jgi:hypothetical protein
MNFPFLKIFIVVSFLSQYVADAQSIDTLTPLKKKPVILIIHGLGGYSQQLKTAPLPVGELTNGGLQGLIRFMVTRSGLITTGLETGLLRLSSMRLRGIVKREIDATLDGIPLFFVLGVQYTGIDFHVGLGSIQTISTSTVNGIAVKSSSWEMGMSTAFGYMKEINHTVSLGGEVRWMGLFDLEKSFLSAGIRIQIVALEF